MLVNVQFLRFIAAMLVVLYHTSAYMPAGNTAGHGLYAAGTAIGFAGVDIFFVISGFIMAHTTLREAGTADGWSFARRRLARIYSGHWPFFLVALLVFNWTRSEHVAQANLLNSFLLWPQPLNRNLLEITWTLSFELYFYLLFTLLVWWSPPRRRPGVCGVVFALLLGLTLYRHFVAERFALEHFYYIPFWNHFLLSPFVLEFFAGTLVAYRLHRHPGGPGLAWLVAGVALFLGAGGLNAWGYAGQIEQGFHVVPRVLAFGAASAMIVTGLVRMEHRGRVAPRAFSLAGGGASYAIYLSHIPVLSLLGGVGYFGWLSGQPFGVASAGGLLAIAAIALYSMAHYRRIERPLHHRFKRWLRLGSA
ncbi:MAG: acyltransferase [Xanthomonadales bacterium]|nr:acyltransferase [Xanthomonadales bacterium]